MGSPRRFIRLGAALAAVAAALPAAGCGGRDNPDLANGKAQFTEKCGSCHVLQRAGTAGKSGPSLDAAFGQSRRDGLGTKTVEGVVADQIDNPLPDTGMPADLVTGDDRRDVAAYVALVAGMPGKDTGALAEAGLAGATSGRQIFTAAGCGACHRFAPAGGTGTTGPGLDDLASKAKGDPLAYTKEGIVKPDATIAPGYQPGVMPDNFGERLDPKQVDALSRFLLKMEK